MVAETCLHSTGTMAGITQVGRVGQTGGMVATSVAEPASQLPILLFLAPSPASIKTPGASCA